MPVIKTHHTNGVLVITISRPDAMNALNVETLDELHKAIHDSSFNSDVKGIVITGDGEKSFVAGADIKELSSLSKEEALTLSQKGQQLFKALENSSKPTIAAINGFALGGGCELAMACHIRLATENAKFGQPEVNLGIIPGYGGTQRLAQLVGRGKALELIMTGDMVTAQEAKSLGLVNHVVATKTELMELAMAMLTKIISKGPVAIANVIKSINAGYSFEDAGYTTEAELFAACTTTQDFKEGTSAFIEKRKPNFTGR
ncbi:MAG TPA: enoyl-CoA hydratase-related protein [Ohtaekwangia sp.]|uniref:enoyl-CoA hydratase/isomerase family protein n=1 Tax=Ohtaekwangia sp. TaxID=2066019 RepID=UPI002F94ABBB